MSRSRSCGCVVCACIWCVMSGQGAKRLYPCISATAREVVRFLAGRGRLWRGRRMMRIKRAHRGALSYRGNYHEPAGATGLT